MPRVSAEPRHPRTLPTARTLSTNGAADPRAAKFAFWMVAIVLTAAALRLTLAAAMPSLSRDGVTYCWYARDLGQTGWRLLRNPDVQQHPLFPALILAVHRAAQPWIAQDGPLLWQRCGQLVSGVSGLAVVVLCAWLARRVALLLDRPEWSNRAALAAAALVAVLPLNAWLSADVMSDSLHAAFYLLALGLALDLRSGRSCLACGVAAGLAFLVRPEGAVTAVGAAAVLASAASSPVRVRLTRLTWLAVGFVVLASPYWIASGKLSAKLEKPTLDAVDALSMLGAPPRWVRLAHGPPSLCRGEPTAATTLDARAHTLSFLQREDLGWPRGLVMTVYHVGRAGRVVVPALAIPVLVFAGRRLLRGGLLGMTVCFVVHFGLLWLLIVRHGYLDPRHALVLPLMLIPMAALALVHLWRQGPGLPRIASRGVALACLGVLAAYAIRIPNGETAHLRRAGAWLSENEPAAGRVLLCGSSQRRVAFYADMRMARWDEEQPDADLRFQDVHGWITHANPTDGPHYFAIETGPGREVRENQALLDRLLRDPASARRLTLRHTEAPAAGGSLYVYRILE